MTQFGVRLLSAMSRSSDATDYEEGAREWDVAGALAILRNEFSGFDDLIRGKQVLDFGCGSGHQSVAMAKAGAAHVLGVDMVPSLLAKARRLATVCGVSDRVEFETGIERSSGRMFDVIVSQDSMEHFTDAPGVLAFWESLLRPGGVALVTFGPPWFAPFGAHMHFFTRVPWVQLLFSEGTVMAVRSKFRNDGAKRYEDVEGGLGKLTVRRFEQLAKRTGFERTSFRLTPVKGIAILSRVPLIRELFTNNVSAVLKRQPKAIQH